MTFQSLKENDHPQIWIQENLNCGLLYNRCYYPHWILCLSYAGFFLTIFFFKSYLQVTGRQNCALWSLLALLTHK